MNGKVENGGSWESKSRGREYLQQCDYGDWFLSMELG